MDGKIIHNQDISSLGNQVFENGKPKVMPYSFYNGIDKNAIGLLMLQYGIYVLPTQELLKQLNLLTNKKA